MRSWDDCSQELYPWIANHDHMQIGKHLVNGIVSTVISVVITVWLAEDGDTYDLQDVALSVAISAFLSGFFTSYFENK